MLIVPLLMAGNHFIPQEASFQDLIPKAIFFAQQIRLNTNSAEVSDS